MLKLAKRAKYDIKHKIPVVNNINNVTITFNPHKSDPLFVILSMITDNVCYPPRLIDLDMLNQDIKYRLAVITSIKKFVDDKDVLTYILAFFGLK